MYYVYILKKKSNCGLYYGYTNNLHRRLDEHNKNKEWDLVYYETFLAEEDARKREIKLKDYGQARAHLKNRIQNSLSI